MNSNLSNPLETLTKDETIRLREQHIGKSCTLFFKDDPLKIVKGDGQYMYDESGNKYLDCINNVAHVGHSNPHVTRAAARQMSLIYTNSRYLHDAMVVYAKRLTQYFPEQLSICYFVNSGSEANDLALRLARAHTQHKDVITHDAAYHGHLTNIVEISPYKFTKIKGHKKKNWVHVAPLPCNYRGKYNKDKHFDDEKIGKLYAREVASLIETAEEKGRHIAAFISESMISCGGQVIPPKGYLKEVYRLVRAAGGVCIADEVQVGFGRIGSSMWAFQHPSNDVIPDIVTLGKPIGNGHPVSCVVTTPEIAASFEGLGAEYFNTFGGNPCSMAIANAVLDVIERDNLMGQASIVGSFLIENLNDLANSYPVIGDVRGCGLFIGVELVRDRTSKRPASHLAEWVVRRFRDSGIIMSTEGKYSNVLKFKPPMTFNLDDARNWINVFTSIMKQIESEDKLFISSSSSSLTSISSVDSLLPSGEEF
ncbi:5-phosphohydroxy-L-lysine phospho-lyase-like [Panonychus citri]|uniref:5-phosphohydroxy-L-lysine phospho-lyase-like n=1 Tax=Panonychus citri TaxID=50023 RepID=UPI002308003F|nr:5-phosphohydroxy-L-lysine phospho-lyase-like [Panonychus citri]